MAGNLGTRLLDSPVKSHSLMPMNFEPPNKKKGQDKQQKLANQI
jgi:hypothetical protein